MNLTFLPNRSVLLISGIYYPDIGGPATFIPKFANALVAKKFQVCTLALTDDKKASRPVESWERIFIRRNLPLPIRFIVTTLRIRLKSNRSRVIFANGLYEEAAVASLFRNKTKVAKIVGDPIWERYRNKVNPKISLEEFNEVERPDFKCYIQRKFLVWSLNQFDVITTPSQQLANIVKKWGVNKDIKVIANGIKIREVALSQKEFDVVTVSRLVTWKNLDKVIEVCQELKLKLAIVGSGPDEYRLRNLVRDDSVLFLGQLNNDEVSECLSKSKVYALLSDYEGLSHSLLEAMNLGIPVIVSSAPGNTAIIRDGENGLVVNIKNKNELVSGFTKLVFNSEYSNQLAKKAKQEVDLNFNLNTQLREFINLLMYTDYAK